MEDRVMASKLAVLSAVALAAVALSGCPSQPVAPGPVETGGQLRVVSLADGKVTGSVPLGSARALDVAVNGDGTLMAAAVSDGAVALCRTSPAVALASRDLATGTAALTAVAFAGDSKRLAVGNADGKLFVFAPNGAKLLELQAHDTGVTALAAADGANLLLSGGRDGVLKAWDLAVGGLVRAQAVVPNGGAVHALAVCTDTDRLATAGADGAIRLWDLDGKKLAVVPAADLGAEVRCLAFSPKGKLLAAGLADGTVRLLDAADNALARGKLQVSKNPIVGVAFLGEDNVLGGCSLGCLKVVDLAGNVVRELPKGTAMNALAVAADGKTAVTGQ
jgi:WD40 repeat protein